MSDNPIDPLDAVNRLTSAGMPRAQAEVHAEFISQLCHFQPGKPVTQGFLVSQLRQFRNELIRELKLATKTDSSGIGALSK